MGLFQLFQNKAYDPDEFEQQLTSITQQISKNRTQLARISQKLRSIKRSLTWYGIALYILYVGYRYKSASQNLGALGSHKSRIQIMLSGQLLYQLLVLMLIPILIAFCIWMVDKLFAIIMKSKSASLNALLKKHREKVEELKKITNFNKTDQILRKFKSPDSVEDGATPQSPKLMEKTKTNSQNSSVMSKKKPNPTINRPQGKPSPKAPSEIDKQQKLTLQERILDFVIGSEHNESVETRFALICANCYVHNGLAPPGCVNPNSVIYICRNCGFKNGALVTSQDLKPSSAPDRDTAAPTELKTTDAEQNIPTVDHVVHDRRNL